MAKVLLVEDDNNLREIYEARLAAEGYEIATAKDGEDALAVAKQFKPDLVVSDVMMPRISGFEMLDILRNTDGLKHTKIIMLTALGQAEDKGRAENLGADRYLVKSQVTLEDIVKAAEELLNPDAVVTPEAAPTPPSDDTLISAAAVAGTQATPAATPATENNTPPATPAAEQPAAPAPAQEQQPATTQDQAPAAPAAMATPPEPDFSAIIDSTATPPATPSEMPAPPPQETVPITAPQTGETTLQPQPTTELTPTTPPSVSVVESPIAVAQTPEATQAAMPQNTQPSLPTADASVTTQSAEAQTSAQPTAQEAAAIEQQIENFENTVTDTPMVAAQPTTEQPAESTAQDDLINQAADALANSIEDTAAASAVAPSENTPTTDPNSDNQIPGEKVIQPLPSSQDDKPNINTLLAQEEARENQAQGITGQAVVVDAAPVTEAGQQTGQPIGAPAVQQQPAAPTPTPPPTPADATVQQPETVFMPNNNGDANTTAL